MANRKKQLKDISVYSPKRLPFAFRVLEKSILNGSYEDWDYVANTIRKYKLVEKYREIN